MKKLVETILDIDELDKQVDNSVSYSVVDYIKKSNTNACASACTEWPLLWDNIGTNSYDNNSPYADFSEWASFGVDDKGEVSAVMDKIFGKVYYDDRQHKFVWSKTEKEIKNNIIGWIIPHLNDMGKHMIRKYKPKAEYYMCDHFHKRTPIRGTHEPFNNAHIQVFMGDTVLFYFAFNFDPTKELQR